MTKSEKQLIKMSVKRLKWSIAGFMVFGVIGLFGGMGLMFTTLRTQTASGVEVGIFGLGAFLVVIAQLLSVREFKFLKKLSDYRKEINDLRDDHYYRMTCVYSKRGNDEKAESFCKLIKDDKKRNTMVGFIFSDKMSKNNNEMFNSLLSHTLGNMKKYGM